MSTVSALQESFTSEVWPVIQYEARGWLYRHGLRGDDLEEAIADTAALCWRRWINKPQGVRCLGSPCSDISQGVDRRPRHRQDQTSYRGGEVCRHLGGWPHRHSAR